MCPIVVWKGQAVSKRALSPATSRFFSFLTPSGYRGNGKLSESDIVNQVQSCPFVHLKP